MTTSANDGPLLFELNAKDRLYDAIDTGGSIREELESLIVAFESSQIGIISVLSIIHEAVEMSAANDVEHICLWMLAKSDFFLKNIKTPQSINTTLKLTTELKSKCREAFPSDKFDKLCGEISYLLLSLPDYNSDSIVNKPGNFSGNVVSYEPYENPQNDMEHLYNNFWKVQTWMANANSFFTERKESRVVINNSQPVGEYQALLDDVMEGLSKGDPINSSKYFYTRYLTGRESFATQVSDANFRLRFFLQIIILMEYVQSLKEHKMAEHYIRLNPVLTEWAKQTQDTAFKNLGKCGRGSKKVTAVIQAILQSDQRWRSWKLSGCPAFEKAPVNTEPVSARITAFIGDARRRPPTYRHKYGTAELTKVMVSDINADFMQQAWEMPSLKELGDKVDSIEEEIKDTMDEEEVEELKHKKTLLDCIGCVVALDKEPEIVATLAQRNLAKQDYSETFHLKDVLHFEHGQQIETDLGDDRPNVESAVDSDLVKDDDVEMTMSDDADEVHANTKLKQSNGLEEVVSLAKNSEPMADTNDAADETIYVIANETAYESANEGLQSDVEDVTSENFNEAADELVQSSSIIHIEEPQDGESKATTETLHDDIKPNDEAQNNELIVEEIQETNEIIPNEQKESNNTLEEGAIQEKEAEQPKKARQVSRKRKEREDYIEEKDDKSNNRRSTRNRG